MKDEEPIFKICHHPDLKAVFAWLRSNMTHLSLVDLTLERLHHFGTFLKAEYEMKILPFSDPSEYIIFKNYDLDLFKKHCIWRKLKGSNPNSNWSSIIDKHIVYGLQNNNLERILLDHVHQSSEYAFSEENLYELFNTDEYFFEIDGSKSIYKYNDTGKKVLNL